MTGFISIGQGRPRGKGIDLARIAMGRNEIWALGNEHSNER